MRIRDWSSDVCSSDLFAIGPAGLHDLGERGAGGGEEIETPFEPDEGLRDFGANHLPALFEAIDAPAVGARGGADERIIVARCDAGAVAAIHPALDRLILLRDTDRKSTRLNSSH